MPVPPAATAKSLTGPQVLSLQRSAGNAAVSRMLSAAGGPVLQRYEVEGSIAMKNDPVHETLTLVAIRDALAKLSADGKTAGSLLGGVKSAKLPDRGKKGDHNKNMMFADKSVQQFIRGVVWPDDPKGYLYDEPSGTGSPSTGTMWFEEFDPDEKDEPEELIARSHYGDLQFLHGMAPVTKEDPKETKRKIVEWASFLTEVSTGRVTGDTKLKDIPTAKRLFPANLEWTVKRLFGYEKAKDLELRQRAAGALLHLVQDSHAEGHTERDAASGDVKEFHSYEHQDEHKHGAKDSWAEGKTLGDRIKNTPGAERAVEKSMQVLVLLDQGASTAEVIKFLDAEVLKLAPDATAAGAGAGFGKKP